MGPLLPLIGTVGRIVGNAAGGMADQRYRENDQRLQMTRDANQNAIQRGSLQSSHALNSAGVDLNRKQFQQNEPGVQARQAMVGNLLERIQPLQMQGLSARAQSSMPRMNSILDALGPEARQAGGLLANRGVTGLQNPTQFDPIQALNLPPAQVAALQKSGWLEKILGAVGLIGSVGGAFGGGTPTSGNGLPVDEFGGG
jgi:hypothetical protein